MNKLWILFGFLFFSSSLSAAPVLNGDATQGGMMWGTVSADTKIWLDDQPVAVHQSGVFVFGFGRDAAATMTLRFEYADGSGEEVSLQIADREFDIERVNGLPPKTVTPPPEWRDRRKVETGRVRSARSVQMPETLWIDGFLKPAEGRFSGFYGSQRILNGEPRSPHYGLDIAAVTGTPVYAPAGGVVRLSAPDFLLEGGIIIVDHGLGVTSTLFHLDTVTVEEGQRVQKGEPIGTIGATGRASGPHVDWRVNWKSVRLDPLLLLEEGEH
ncbi:MAG: M23 family metallopeptidase [Kordiimonadaceae bacterium]|nr:M23 family metallopeptidase [Kordiimonadaceae bacterium]MBO6567559.1 M23 family metallopeptidase [Kordiimonadaceae bacterium]MBO6963227.1 M23 family metallopeptidase [Kordiimonadaceae bacterium]